MREIKFRAWNPKTKEIIDNIFLVPGESTENVMQYTGLKDRNGKEIYEGDIVKDEGVVFKKDAAFQVKNYPLMNFFIEGFEDKKSKLEVIGNIHENPELL